MEVAHLFEAGLLKPGEEAIKAGTVIRGFPGIRVAAVHPAVGFGKDISLIFEPMKPSPYHKPLRITVKSLEVNHQPLDAVLPGEDCGVALDCSCKQLPRRGDKVWLVLSPRQIAEAIAQREQEKIPRVFTVDDDGAC